MKRITAYQCPSTIPMIVDRAVARGGELLG
jgi:hypothetical protein